MRLENVGHYQFFTVCPGSYAWTNVIYPAGYTDENREDQSNCRLHNIWDLSWQSIRPEAYEPDYKVPSYTPFRVLIKQKALLPVLAITHFKDSYDPLLRPSVVYSVFWHSEHTVSTRWKPWHRICSIRTLRVVKIKQANKQKRIWEEEGGACLPQWACFSPVC